MEEGTACLASQLPPGPQSPPQHHVEGHILGMTLSPKSPTFRGLQERTNVHYLPLSLNMLKSLLPGQRMCCTWTSPQQPWHRLDELESLASKWEKILGGWGQAVLLKSYSHCLDVLASQPSDLSQTLHSQVDQILMGWSLGTIYLSLVLGSPCSLKCLPSPGPGIQHILGMLHE